MGIEYQDRRKVKLTVQAFRLRLEAHTINMLKYLGEKLVAYAKEQYNYTDRTGNLTNSIGYVVVQDATPVYFGGLNQPGEGARAGLNHAMKVASQSSSSISLIVVAGMHYAAYVEAKGYNVILPAELKARKDFPRIMNKLVKRARSRANELFGDII